VLQEDVNKPTLMIIMENIGISTDYGLMEIKPLNVLLLRIVRKTLNITNLYSLLKFCLH